MLVHTPTALFLSRLAKSGARPIRSQLHMVANLLNWPNEDVENLPFHELTFIQIEQVKQMRIAQGRSNKTINTMLFALKSIVKTGFLMGMVEEREWLTIDSINRLSNTASQKGKALSANDIQTLLVYLSTNTSPIFIRDSAILGIFLAAGLRRFELAALHMEDINVIHWTLTVKKGKGDKARLQPLPNWVHPLITRWVTIKGDKGHLFCAVWKGVLKPERAISPENIYRIVRQRVKEALGLSISPHDLRRTFITELLRNQVDLITTSKLAGHASVSTTQIYDKRDESVMREAVSTIKYL